MGEAAAVFADTLARYNYGHALWWPQPTKGLNRRLQEVEIGDVGYVDEDGAFHTLFNITYSATHERNAGGTPVSFVPLAFDSGSVDVKEQFCTRGPLYSTTVKSREVEAQTTAYVLLIHGDSQLGY
jgi:hypothetical protein